MIEAPNGRPTDADLVGFLDGELRTLQARWVASWLARDEELQQRLNLLAQGNGALRGAFGALLAEAPQAKLEAMLHDLPGYRAGVTVRSERGSWRIRRGWPRLALLAAGLAVFVAGAFVDRLVPEWREAIGIEVAGDSEAEWREAVAQYMSLYTPETLVRHSRRRNPQGTRAHRCRREAWNRPASGRDFPPWTRVEAGTNSPIRWEPTRPDRLPRSARRRLGLVHLCRWSQGQWRRPPSSASA